MQEITVYEVLKAKFDEEGNYTTKKSGIFFLRKDDALDFAGSQRYGDCFGEQAVRFSRLTDQPPLKELVAERKLIAYSNLSEYDKTKERADRHIAFEKLSKRERELLGL